MNGSSYGLPNFFVDKGTGYYSVAASRNGAAFVKFEVKAGRAFDGEVTVVVKVEPERKTIPLRKVLVGTVIGTVALLVLVAIVYGMATGNYAIIRTIAESVKEIFVEVAAKIAMKSK
jgi:hypothetical protein